MVDSNQAAPVEVVKELIERMASREWDRALELYDDDVEISLELGIPGPVTVPGKAALVAAVTDESGHPRPSRLYDDLEVRDLTILETEVPGVVVAQWTYVSHIEGTEVVNRNCIVAEVREGRVVRSRDYHNHVTRAVADGHVTELVSVIAGMALPGEAN